MVFGKNKIKNIIFDLGGVIINIDNSLLIQAFSKIGLPDFEEFFCKNEYRNLFNDFEKGLISSQNFRNALKVNCNPGTTDEEIDTAWNSMLLDIPKERMDLLMQIKSTYRIFLLSNTNEIHMRFINNYITEKFQINDFYNIFEKVYLSFEVNMQKPDAKIFELIINQNNLVSEETLFIDDTMQHIESAKEQKIKTLLLDIKTQSIVNLF
ncbi:MAG: HAD family phosphatase [Bacteroidetes bacterium]|nr:HAD family phosphatase [Bacteroidota bacterium]